MKKIIYISFFLIIISSCKKEERTYSVTYKIVETSTNTPTYTIRYSLKDGSSQSANTAASSWTTGSIEGYKAGDVLNLQIEGSGGGEYTMQILVNGNSGAKRFADDSNGPQTLETIL